MFNSPASMKYHIHNKWTKPRWIIVFITKVDGEQMHSWAKIQMHVSLPNVELVEGESCGFNNSDELTCFIENYHRLLF